MSYPKPIFLSTAFRDPSLLISKSCIDSNAELVFLEDVSLVALAQMVVLLKVVECGAPSLFFALAPCHLIHMNSLMK